MQNATEQRASMRAAGIVEPVCEQIQALVEQATTEHGQPAAHELCAFLVELTSDLEEWEPHEVAAA